MNNIETVLDSRSINENDIESVVVVCVQHCELYVEPYA